MRFFPVGRQSVFWLSAVSAVSASVFALSIAQICLASQPATGNNATLQCDVKKASAWVNEENIGKKPAADEKDVPLPYRTYDFYAVTDVTVTNKTSASLPVSLSAVELSINGKPCAAPVLSLDSKDVQVDKDLRHFQLPGKKKANVSIRMAGNYGIKHKNGTPVISKITLNAGKEEIKVSSKTQFDDAFVGLQK